MFNLVKSFFISILLSVLIVPTFSQNTVSLCVVKPGKTVKPLEELIICTNSEGTIKVTDSKGKTYFTSNSLPQVSFLAGGASGVQTITLLNSKGAVIATTNFELIAKTDINDGGKMSDMFQLFYKSMLVYDENGYEELDWNGNKYRCFVHWALDNNNTMNGMQYFSPYSGDLVDIFRETQLPNGMIWSYVKPKKLDSRYNETAYSPINFFRKDSTVWFARQPAENHVEYNYVNMIYKNWKGSANTDWMKTNLESAARALDFCITDSIRWSKRFQLLKRPFCIDSWDFQIDDKYTPETPIGKTMMIVPGKTKYGIFFGDNTGYFDACNQLAEMYEYVGDKINAEKFRTRALQIIERLNRLSWNGQFYTHFIDEDSTVIRDLGVDNKLQIAQGNMYSLNRGLPHDMNVAIIKTYQQLKSNLPGGSSAEWYSIFPPFEKGFVNQNPKWQYMNGGIAAHAAGELAKGAFENGFENYGSDILNRLYNLGKQYNNRIYFAYTGAYPTPDKAKYKTIDFSKNANMDFWDKGGKNAFKWMNENRQGNDLRNFPTGNQVFHNIKFDIINPVENQQKAAIAVANLKGFPSEVEVSINDTAQTVYLIHSTSANKNDKTVGSISFIYTDGTTASKYIYSGKDLVGWWFPKLEKDNAGIAWSGINPVSAGVGVCWAAIQNPNPSKRIKKLRFNASIEGDIYSILAITLADKPHYVKPNSVSYGGPDNWAAANAMRSLIEGLAGIKNTGLGYETTEISPRWASAGVDSISVTANLVASGGYVAYQFKNDISTKTISMNITGSGKNSKLHLLLPSLNTTVKSVLVNNQPVNFNFSKVEDSNYLDIDLIFSKIQRLAIKY